MSTITPSEALRLTAHERAVQQVLDAARLLATARETFASIAMRTDSPDLLEESDRAYQAVQSALVALADYRSPAAAGPELLDIDQVDELLQQGYGVFSPMPVDDGQPTRGQWGAGTYTLGDGLTLTVLRGGNGVLELDTRNERV